MAEQDIALTPPAERPPSIGQLMLVITVDHKQLGFMYIGSADFLAGGGSYGRSHRAQLLVPHNTRCRAGLQLPLHHAWHGDGFSSACRSSPG
jgi:hypothetical protein